MFFFRNQRTSLEVTSIGLYVQVEDGWGASAGSHLRHKTEMHVGAFMPASKHMFVLWSPVLVEPGFERPPAVGERWPGRQAGRPGAPVPALL